LPHLLARDLRRHETVSLILEQLEQREEHLAIVDLQGNAGHARTAPVPGWVMEEVRVWSNASGIDRGNIFRREAKVGRLLSEGMTEKAIWHIVKIARLFVDIRQNCLRPKRNWALQLG